MLKLVEELKVVQERLAISFSIRGIFLDIGVVMAISGYRGWYGYTWLWVCYGFV